MYRLGSHIFPNFCWPSSGWQHIRRLAGYCKVSGFSHSLLRSRDKVLWSLNLYLWFDFWPFYRNSGKNRWKLVSHRCSGDGATVGLSSFATPKWANGGKRVAPTFIGSDMWLTFIWRHNGGAPQTCFLVREKNSYQNRILFYYYEKIKQWIVN